MASCKNLSCPALPQVRIGLIGLGDRGIATLQRYMVISGAEIVAISDLQNSNLDLALSMLAEHNCMTPLTFHGEKRWMQICESDQVDLVYICTDWHSHADMAMYAMHCGKHVALEVPAAMSVRECWQLVHTAEETQRHCIMLENCCYDTFHLGVMGMKKLGVFGEITHCEGAYIHDLRDHKTKTKNGHGAHKEWMQQTTSQHGGNPYPTHGLGPMCQLLDINRGDRLLKITSMTALNHLNNSLISTASGRTILLQFDETTPRPYSRIQTLCGTKGFVQKYPTATLQIEGKGKFHGDEAIKEVESYQDSDMKRIIAEGGRLNVPNVMNYTMDRRLIDALIDGQPLDMDVYDAALWSCITELSARSAQIGGLPIDIPDFTMGNWK